MRKYSLHKHSIYQYIYCATNDAVTREKRHCLDTLDAISKRSKFCCADERKKILWRVMRNLDSSGI